MKLALFVTASALSLAAVLPTAALADSVVMESGPSSVTQTTVQESVPSTTSTTVVKDQPVYVAPTEEKTTIVDKRKKHHLLSLPFIHVL
ncbi:MAG TPA: hypothetical protein V6C86_23555 [Oculatellaceae cyanobacterium]